MAARPSRLRSQSSEVRPVSPRWNRDSSWECPRCHASLPASSHQCWTCSAPRPPTSPCRGGGGSAASRRSPLDSERLRKPGFSWEAAAASGGNPRLDFGGYHNVSTASGVTPVITAYYEVSDNDVEAGKQSPGCCQSLLTVLFLLGAIACGAKFLLALDPDGLPEPVLAARQQIRRPYSGAEYAVESCTSFLREWAATIPGLESLAGSPAAGAMPGAAQETDPAAGVAALGYQDSPAAAPAPVVSDPAAASPGLPAQDPAAAPPTPPPASPVTDAASPAIASEDPAAGEAAPTPTPAGQDPAAAAAATPTPAPGGEDASGVEALSALPPSTTAIGPEEEKAADEETTTSN